MGEVKHKVIGIVWMIFSSVLPLCAMAQDGLVANFTFDNATTDDETGGPPAKAVGVSFGDDRFGNSRSACFLAGTANSYLNLGTDSILKPREGTISLWVKMIAVVYSGDGYDCNPIILTKNAEGDDFFEAYSLGYEYNNKRVGATSTLSSQEQVSALSTEDFVLNEWHHLVVTYSDSSLCLYVDGVKESEVVKSFRTKFLAGDSVMVGYSANKKNRRFMAGYVDDIAIYNKVLSPVAVAELFDAGDPNRYRTLILFILGVVVVVGLLIAFMIWKFRQALKREKEKNRIQRQVFEMETRVIKAQMNPHFIFNSMNSIQQFILADDTGSANTYLVKFAKLLRKILESSSDESITLDNEVDVLHKYIEIESLRFESAFSYQIEVDRKLDASNTRIPHMLVQPFVENAIWHGLLSKKGEKNLRISFEYLADDTLLCVVDDNGVGRSTERVPPVIVEKKSVSVQFTAQRLELMNKEWDGSYGVEITDKKNENGSSRGTAVRITIPILKN